MAFPVGLQLVATAVAPHHRRRKNSPECNPPGRMAEILPCTETQACGCFSSSHRTCRQLLGDFEHVASLSTAQDIPMGLIDHHV